MFIGHYAVGFASKRFAPKTSLGSLILAPLWLDVLWPFFLLTGIERASIVPGITKVMPVDLEYYPYSHSLVASIFWGTLLGGLYFFLRKNLKASLVIGIGVISHWVLDFLTHRRDLPITLNGEERFGLGLWNFPVIAFLVEAIFFLVCLWLYLKSTSAANPIGRIGLWIYVSVLFGLFCGQFSGIVPPDIKTVALSAFLLFPLIPLAHWIDKNRVSV
jgi:hypothetical protein